MAATNVEPRAGNPRPVPSSSKLLRHISVLATLTDELGELTDAAVFVKGPEIAWVGLDADLPPEALAADEVFDCSGYVMMPGMVNTHAHLFQSLTRCIAQDKQLHGWLKTLYPVWAKYTPQDMELSTKLSLVELVLSGCTTTSDHCYIWPNDCKLDDTIKAARDVGVRFVAVRGSMCSGVSKGGIAPDSCIEEEPAILEDSERCITEFHDNSKFSMLRVALGPSSQKVVTTQLMAATAALARKHAGVRLHTHLAENDEDIVYTRNVYGYDGDMFAQYITKANWDQSDCWFAHCCKLNTEEQDLFAARGIGIAHCPGSNTRLASGICPVRGMLERGVNVGIGVDGAASSDSLSILAESRLAMLLQRSGGNPGALSVRQTLRCATIGGAVNLGWDNTIGQIKPGYAADIIGWQMEGNLGFAGAGCDPLGALLMCAPSVGNVHLSIINGKVVVRDGKLLTVDVGQVVREANAAAKRLHAELTPENLGAGGYKVQAAA